MQQFRRFARTSVLGTAIFAAASLAGLGAQAATYPERTIRIVTPYNPGSMVDLTTRIVAEGLSEVLGQTVVVENRVGGVGLIAMNGLLNAPADGYTLLTDTPASAINPTLNNARYNAKTDIAPIAQFMRLPFVLGVSPGLKVNSAQELVELARKDPGAINIAVAGTSTGLVGDLFAQQAQAKFNNIPYSGAGAAVLAVLKDEAQVIFLDSANLVPHINGGKMKGLLLTADERAEVLKQVPTAKEAGYGQFAPTSWFGLFSRADVPADVQKKLNDAVRQVMATPKVKEFMAQRGASASNMSVQEFRTFFHGEIDAWAEMIQKAGLLKK